MNNFRRIYKYKCGSRSHMRVANTENRFQPLGSAHIGTYTLEEHSNLQNEKNNRFCFEKVEKMNNFRRILRQKCGSRFSMSGFNTHNKFQAPRTRRTDVIRLGSEWD